jgi:hypothetical protein
MPIKILRINITTVTRYSGNKSGIADIIKSVHLFLYLLINIYTLIIPYLSY